MAFQSFLLCDVSSSTGVEVLYDPVSKAIDGFVLGACEFGYTQVSAGDLIYEHEDSVNYYELRFMGGAPYAYLTTIPKEPCSVTITNVAVGNASTESSTDGSIVITATGPYSKLYSKNNGLNYQSSNSFTNLAPGTYNIRVRSQHLDGSVCYDTETVEVGFNAISNCTLELGQIISTNPSTVGNNDGSILVNTIVNTMGLPVEYRLDAGAWQSSPLFENLVAGTYNVQVRYVDYTSCGDNRDVDMVDEGVDCDIHIQTVVVTHEQTKFGEDGQIVVIATTSNGTLEYSIDNGDNYQSSNTFTGLAPGTYQVRVKDASNCQDARAVEVQPYKAPYFDYPIANGIRMVVRDSPLVDNTLQNFDNRLFKDERFPGVEPGCYSLLRQTSDTDEKMQWRSSYANHTLTIRNADTDAEVGQIECTKVKDFTRQTEENLAALLADAGANKTQVFFENGLPEWAVEGQTFTLNDTGEAEFDGIEFEIEEVRAGTLDAEGYVVMIIAVVFPTTGVIGGTLDVEYDIELFDVWEAAPNWSDYAAGRYYLVLEATDDQFEDTILDSEPIHVAVTHKDTVLIRARNNDNAYKIFYDTGITHLMRVHGVLRRPQPGGSEVNHEESNGRFVKLWEQVTRNPELFIDDVPPYLAEKLALYCGHDSLVVNGVEHGKQDEKVQITYFDDDNDPFCNAQIKLRQIDFIAENSDDGGDVDTPDTVLEVNGTLLKLTT